MFSGILLYSMNEPWKHYDTWNKAGIKGKIYDSTYMSYLELGNS